MKITVEYTENSPSTEIIVQSARYIGDFVIRLFFANNENKAVDFKPFLTQAIHPSIKKYLREELFTSFKIEHGNLNWNDYELIFPVADLYENSILKKKNE